MNATALQGFPMAAVWRCPTAGWISPVTCYCDDGIRGCFIVHEAEGTVPMRVFVLLIRRLRAPGDRTVHRPARFSAFEASP